MIPNGNEVDFQPIAALEPFPEHVPSVGRSAAIRLVRWAQPTLLNSANRYLACWPDGAWKDEKRAELQCGEKNGYEESNGVDSFCPAAIAARLIGKPD